MSLTSLDGCIELLNHTRHIVKLFKSDKPIRSRSDLQLENVKNALTFFNNWEKEIQTHEDLKDMEGQEKARRLMSWETREDLQCIVIGFEAYNDQYFTQFRHGYIIPAMCNSDAVENVFCSIRSAKGGANCHPTLLQYKYALTSVVLSTGLYSIHGNAFSTQSAKPFLFHTSDSLRNGRKTKRPKFT